MEIQKLNSQLKKQKSLEFLLDQQIFFCFVTVTKKR